MAVLFWEAHYQLEALYKTLEVTQLRLMYYQNLLNVGLIADEKDNLSLTDQSMIAQAVAQFFTISSQAATMVPDSFVGPVPLLKIPGGENIGRWQRVSPFATAKRVRKNKKVCREEKTF